MAKYNRDEYEYGSGPSRQEDRNVVDMGGGRSGMSQGARSANGASRGSEYDYKKPAGTNPRGVYDKIRVRQSNGGYTSYPGQGNKTTDLVYRGEKPQTMKLPYTGSAGNEHMQLGDTVYRSSEGEPPAYQGRERYRSSEGEPPQLAYDKAAGMLGGAGSYGGYQTYAPPAAAGGYAPNQWGRLGGYGMQQITPTWNEGDRNAALRESSKLAPVTGQYDINGDGKTNADDVHLMQDSIDGKTPMDADRLAQMYGITQGDYLSDKKAIENATGGHRDISYRLDDPTGYVQNIRDGAQGYNDTVQGIKDGTVGINDFDRSVVDPSVLAQGYDKNLSGYKDDYAQAQKLLEGFENIDTSVVDPAQIRADLAHNMEMYKQGEADARKGLDGHEEIDLTGVDPSILADKNRSAFDAYTQAVKAAEDKLNNQSAFSYDLNGDALYQQYREQAMKAARKNSENAMQQAAAMNGGYGSSYASAMAGQAYSEAMGKLDNILPELYGQAYNRYLNDRTYNTQLANDSMSRAENLLGKKLTTGANEYTAEVNANDTGYTRSTDNRDYYYQKYRDQVGDIKDILGRNDSASGKSYDAQVDANQMGYGRAIDRRDYQHQKSREAVGDAKDLMGRNDTVNANNYGAQVDANNTTYDRNRDKRDFDYGVARDNIGDAQYNREQTAAEEGNIYKAQTSANDQYNTLMQQDRDFWETLRQNDLDRAFNEWAQRNGMADSLYSAGRQELEDAYQRFLDDRQQQNYEKEFDLQKEQWLAEFNQAQDQIDFQKDMTQKQFDLDKEDQDWNHTYKETARTWDAAYTAAEAGDYSMLGKLTGQQELFDNLTKTAQGQQALDQAYKAAQVGDYSGLKALGINTEQLEIQDMLNNQNDRVTLANKIAAFRATYGYDPFDGSPSGGGYGGGASGSGHSGGSSGYSGGGSSGGYSGSPGSSGAPGANGSNYQPLTGAQKPIGSAAEKQKYKDLYGDDWEMIYYSVYSG